MDPAEFAAKWKGSTLTERAASQSHFSDMCAMVGWRTPSDLDPVGEGFAFEKVPRSWAAATASRTSG